LNKGIVNDNYLARPTSLLLQFKLKLIMSESIGMMDKAYFVGKVAILQWFNELLDVSQSPLLNLSVAPQQN